LWVVTMACPAVIAVSVALASRVSSRQSVRRCDRFCVTGRKP
jgi:hypothetical protein